MKIDEQRMLLRDIPELISFCERMGSSSAHCITSTDIETLQINLGKMCNLSCKHCHVNAGPNSKEIMPHDIVEKCLKIVKSNNIPTLDITGGAPEMNPHLQWLLEEINNTQTRVIVRSNLAVLDMENYHHFIDLYADNKIEIVTSLPDFNEEKSDRQRGSGIFKKVIKIIKLLNERGYGRDDSELKLHIVHNPVGSYLPGSQKALAAQYKKILKEDYNIVFNDLYTITNVPVGRYLDYLVNSDNLYDYMSELSKSYNHRAAENVMCKTTLSVGWDGILYDCDFNQMLEMPVQCNGIKHINDFDFNNLQKREIVTGNHCYGCTAGAGSSCQGETIIK